MSQDKLEDITVMGNFKKYMQAVYPQATTDSPQYFHSKRVWFCAYLDCLATLDGIRHSASMDEAGKFVHRIGQEVNNEVAKDVANVLKSQGLDSSNETNTPK